jgi:hypothetical protein
MPYAICHVSRSRSQKIKTPPPPQVLLNMVCHPSASSASSASPASPDDPSDKHAKRMQDAEFTEVMAIYSQNELKRQRDYGDEERKRKLIQESHEEERSLARMLYLYRESKCRRYQDEENIEKLFRKAKRDTRIAISFSKGEISEKQMKDILGASKTLVGTFSGTPKSETPTSESPKSETPSSETPTSKFQKYTLKRLCRIDQ